MNIINTETKAITVYETNVASEAPRDFSGSNLCFGISCVSNAEAKNSYHLITSYLFNKSLIRLSVSRLNEVSVIGSSKSCFEHVVIVEDQALRLRG